MKKQNKVNLISLAILVTLILTAIAIIAVTVTVIHVYVNPQSLLGWLVMLFFGAFILIGGFTVTVFMLHDVSRILVRAFMDVRSAVENQLIKRQNI